MEVKLFQKTQRDLASCINEVIDRYWQNEMDEDAMIRTIKKLYAINQAKMVKDGQYTTVIRQQCGKNRLAVVDTVLNMK
ncbi:TIGR04540 family protein [Gracilibacillus xinjiangensis]|uniref:TIGR04540 family protein n=1 Tax=Gracilibacillus xinjiangensis TaxID=1193282 RepID=A0ABV8WRF1_9BACI